MEGKFDFKKEFKDLYLPKKKPSIVNVPKMLYIGVEGKGDPNKSIEYKAAVGMLYGLSFTIKMSKMSGDVPKGYFEYVVPPLEGFWSVEGEGFDGMNITDKNKLGWLSVIRQPEFVTEAVFENAKIKLSKKHPEYDLSKAKLFYYEEGECVQIMHIGAYDNEPASIKLMNDFILEQGFENDFENRRHHEIYLSDPRRTAVEKLKTVIRHPIKHTQKNGL